MTITSLIAGNSDRYGRRQSAAKPRKRNVQRLVREHVGPSGSKREATRPVEDIVLSAWKHVAAFLKAGYLLALSTRNHWMFNGQPIVSDSHCPAQHLFMLNMDHLHLFYHPKRNFSMEPWQKPINQQVKVTRALWMGALGSSNNRLHGKMSAITT